MHVEGSESGRWFLYSFGTLDAVMGWNRHVCRTRGDAHLGKSERCPEWCLTLVDGVPDKQDGIFTVKLLANDVNALRYLGVTQGRMDHPVSKASRPAPLLPRRRTQTEAEGKPKASRHLGFPFWGSPFGVPLLF